MFFTKKKNVSLFISVTIILLIILFTAVPRVVDLFTDTLAQSISSLFTESDSYHMKSIETRVELIKHSMTMLFESYLFGVGAGNFSDNMTFDRIYSTSGIAIPHNYFFEILATFGLVITLLWFLFIIYIGITLLIKNFGNEKSNIQLASGFAMILLVPASTLPSTIMLFFSHWIIIALSISLVKFNKTFLIKT
ncbi:MAG: hypothetical protein APR54_10295 [Candidatus Cloacimonas sp. SDB]|nr:MAG: hypothetical protein APR54_10295 [Candidatus Cloacimonas sp. SDB]